MQPTLNSRKPYAGSHRALAIALDVGTTFSGVSYAFLEPGQVPKILGVTRYVQDKISNAFPCLSNTLFTRSRC